jgi:site-specific DNA recombinase
LLQDIESIDKESIRSQYESKIEKIDRFYYLYNKQDSQQDTVECNRLLKLIINKVLYARGDAESVITSPLERYEASQGIRRDYIELLIESK